VIEQSDQTLKIPIRIEVNKHKFSLPSFKFEIGNPLLIVAIIVVIFVILMFVVKKR